MTKREYQAEVTALKIIKKNITKAKKQGLNYTIIKDTGKAFRTDVIKSLQEFGYKAMINHNNNITISW